MAENDAGRLPQDDNILEVMADMAMILPLDRAEELLKILLEMGECNRRIKKLETAVVNWNSNNKTSFQRLSTQQNKLVSLFNRACEISGYPKDAGRPYLIDRDMEITGIEAVDSLLNVCINIDHQYCPTFEDVAQCIKLSNRNKNLRMNRAAQKCLAEYAYPRIVSTFKRLRQTDFYDSFANMYDDDPAKTDAALFQKLADNSKIAQQRLTQLIDDFAQRDHEQQFTKLTKENPIVVKKMLSDSSSTPRPSTSAHQIPGPSSAPSPKQDPLTGKFEGSKDTTGIRKRPLDFSVEIFQNATPPRLFPQQTILDSSSSSDISPRVTRLASRRITATQSNSNSTKQNPIFAVTGPGNRNGDLQRIKAMETTKNGGKNYKSLRYRTVSDKDRDTAPNDHHQRLRNEEPINMSENAKRARFNEKHSVSKTAAADSGSTEDSSSEDVIVIPRGPSPAIPTIEIPSGTSSANSPQKITKCMAPSSNIKPSILKRHVLDTANITKNYKKSVQLSPIIIVHPPTESDSLDTSVSSSRYSRDDLASYMTEDEDCDGSECRPQSASDTDDTSGCCSDDIQSTDGLLERDQIDGEETDESRSHNIRTSDVQSDAVSEQQRSSIARNKGITRDRGAYVPNIMSTLNETQSSAGCDTSTIAGGEVALKEQNDEAPRSFFPRIGFGIFNRFFRDR